MLTHASRKFVVSKTCHWHLFEGGAFRTTTRNLFYLKKVPSFIRLAPYKLPSKKRLMVLGDFTRCDGRPKALPLETTSFEKLDQTFYTLTGNKMSRISPILDFLSIYLYRRHWEKFSVLEQNCSYYEQRKFTPDTRKACVNTRAHKIFSFIK